MANIVMIYCMLLKVCDFDLIVAQSQINVAPTFYHILQFIYLLIAKLSPSRLALALAWLRLVLVFNSPPTHPEKVVKPQKKVKPSLA